MGLEEDNVTGSEHSKPTTPTSDSAADNIAESQADTIDPDKSSLNDGLESQADAATLDSVEMTEDAAEKEPLASTSGTSNNKRKVFAAGALSNSESADDLISEDDIIAKSRFDEDDSERLNTCTEDFESQVSNEGSKKTWDVRCVVIGVLILLILIAGAVAAIIAHRIKGPPIPYDFKFASVFGDGMVLQRAPHKAVVWGYGPILGENTTVKVTLSGPNFEKEFYTHVKSKRHQGQVWKVLLDTVTDPVGPYTLTATLDVENKQEVYIKDVLFGDVYVCAGQFEMDFKLRDLYNTSEEDGMDNLRLLELNPYKSNFPKDDIRHLIVPWTSAGNLNVGYQAMFPRLCYEYGRALHLKLGYPIGLISMSDSDSVIEDWTPHRALRNCHLKPTDSSSTVWHGMVNPLLNMAFYGAVWYQGEPDAIQFKSMFNCTFTGFIEEWRNHSLHHTRGAMDPWDFPFGIIQLPPNRTAVHTAYKSFTDIRWSQTANYGLVPNEQMKKTFLVSTIDLPEIEAPEVTSERPERVDANSVIVERLMLGTMAVGYRRKNITYQAPFPTQYKISSSDHSIVVFMNNNTAHVATRSTSGFEVCCSDSPRTMCLASFTKATYAPGREWIPAPITSHDSSSVSLAWDSCKGRHPVGLRYAWRETPCKWKECAVYGALSDLPMLPYIRQNLVNDGEKHNLEFKQVDLF